MQFCNQCGSTLIDGAATPTVEPPRAEGATERRVVSVLFADLVGFTSLSESRDAEEVRELLSRYFENAQRLIERYGGIVEKFIGDAVMAVWGTPVAQEDDAERAVRSALDLVSAVASLGDETGSPELKARAAVLTGEAAVTLGANGQGMVAGDLVNTASRVQSIAQPGTVLVGKRTRHATEAAIAYEEAGAHALKGKVEPVPLWRALRVTAGRAGAQRSKGLEPPFVGRDRELRLVKDLFHASAEEEKAQLVSVIGIAGIGKSRLSWEFEKYADGLAGELWWHRGRCLSYGEGVAYWALAEIVRMRCDIADDEDAESAARKLSATIAEHIPDAKEQRWVEPRLAHLLGLDEGAAGDQENLFSAWRILFERLSEENPVVLVFEDMQWADAGLVEFIEYLLEWSRNHPIFVLALARPEVIDRWPSWGAGKRNFASIYLEPLSAEAMGELLSGLVPGLSEEIRTRIFERAEGVPLYAVETVRMLLDRGLLAREGNVYRPTGPVETLEVPDTLHALVAARLDSLTTDERRLAQDASVLGKTFTIAGLTAVTGLRAAEVEPLLTSLQRKEIIAIQADPRSPERGQYSFVQDIVKLVAYETIAKRERKVKHLAAADFLMSVAGSEEDEIAEIVATHYLDAYEAAPEAADAAELRARARNMVVRAAERAASLGANAEAQRSFERAVDLTDEDLTRAELYERAGLMARAGARSDEAAAHFESSIALFEASGATHPAARVSARLAEVSWERGRLEEGLESMDGAFEVLSREEPDVNLASLAAELGRFRFFAGDMDLALERVETALDLAEALSLPEIVSQALNTKALILIGRGRRTEGLTLLRSALALALEHDKPSAALRAYFNLGDALGHPDRYAEAVTAVRDGLMLARRVGNRWWEWQFLGQVYPFFALGEWDEAQAMIAELPDERWPAVRTSWPGILLGGAIIDGHRGRLEEAELIVARCSVMQSSADLQERSAYLVARANLLLMSGDPAHALECAESAFGARNVVGITQEYLKQAFVAAVEAALEVGDLAKVEELLTDVDSLAPGHSSQFLQAHLLRFRARHAGWVGNHEGADEGFKSAADLFRELEFRFYLAVTMLERAEWLRSAGEEQEAESLTAEARPIFEDLDAKPWLERLSQAEPAHGAEAVAHGS